MICFRGSLVKKYLSFALQLNNKERNMGLLQLWIQLSATPEVKIPTSISHTAEAE